MSALVNSFFDTSRTAQFNLLHLSLSMHSEIPTFSLLGKGLNESDRLDSWINATSYFHELRHFHDLVGSVCGFHTLLESTRLVDEVLACLQNPQAPKVRAPMRSAQPHFPAARM